jgi:hypothetical protein
MYLLDPGVAPAGTSATHPTDAMRSYVPWARAATKRSCTFLAVLLSRPTAKPSSSSTTSSMYICRLLRIAPSIASLFYSYFIHQIANWLNGPLCLCKASCDSNVNVSCTIALSLVEAVEVLVGIAQHGQTEVSPPQAFFIRYWGTLCCVSVLWPANTSPSAANCIGGAGHRNRRREPLQHSKEFRRSYRRW